MSMELVPRLPQEELEVVHRHQSDAHEDGVGEAPPRAYWWHAKITGRTAHAIIPNRQQELLDVQGAEERYSSMPHQKS